jgi:hypothetical protein
MNKKQREKLEADWSVPEYKRPLYYKRDGTPYLGEDAVLQWGRDCEPPKDPEARKKWFKEVKVVKQEHLWWGAWLSTVWLGIDYSFMNVGRPIIFESMLFSPFAHPDDFWPSGLHWFRNDLDMDRYSTEEEAMAGHKQLKQKWSRIDVACIHFTKSLWNSFSQSLRILTPILVRNALTGLLGQKLSAPILSWLRCMPKPSYSDRFQELVNSPASGDTKTKRKTSTTLSLESNGSKTA